MERAKRILKEVFGFDDFRPLQAEIVKSVLDREDLLAIMPTGGGKSLCYQLPAILSQRLTVVVSPLISLMKDQVDQLTQLGIPAAILNSALVPEAYRRNVEMIRSLRARLLYLAPESLLKPSILELLKSVPVDCLAIDEAHCISFWGHEFRPEYRKLQDIRQNFPDAVCAAFTATATPRVREDIKECLGFSQAREFVASFDRENLFLEVRPKENAWSQLLDFIRRFPEESGIVYCFTRKQVDALYSGLREEGFSALPYHAGLNDAQRAENQEKFIRDDIRIVVATIAFGMGIDKPNIRFVVHYDLPKTLEHYYQEIGRAGRDGLPAHCLLFLGYGDIRKIRHFIDQGQNSEEKRIARVHLGALLHYAETEDCRRSPLLSYFGETFEKQNCGMCDNCKAEKKPTRDVTIEAQKFMSCVKRTGERFGANHVIDVLRGSKAKKILKFCHDRLSTYGIGTDLSKRQWFALCRKLLGKGYMNQDMRYGSLMVTEKGWEVLRGNEKVRAHIEEETPEAPAEVPKDLPFDRELFQSLRKLRKSLSDEADVPPYVVFPDKTLVEMSTFFPQSPESLENIHGVGKVKLDTYGPAFLEEIGSYCRKKGIEEVPFSRPSLSKSKTAAFPGKKRHHEVAEAFSRGKSIEDLMKAYAVKESTVLRHLYDYLREGRRISPDRFLGSFDISSDLRTRVFGHFDDLGFFYLKPVYEAMQGHVAYEDLHRLRVHYMCVRGPEAVSENAAKGAAVGRKAIVCLANSRKYSGCCVAGKDFTEDGPVQWVRPVAPCPMGELTVQCTLLENSEIPRPLDILEIPLKRPYPKDYQTENFLISDGPWKKTGRFPVSELDSMCDWPDSLWLNGWSAYSGVNDRMPEELVKERVTSSLYLVRPDDLNVVVCENAKLLKKVRVDFRYRGETYCLPATDPDLEKYFIEQPLGEYPAQNDDVYLTVSISEPFEGFCYKLVAAVLNLEI